MKSDNQISPYMSRIYRAREAALYLGISRSTLYRLLAQEGTALPAPVRLGPNSVGWDIADLDAYIDAKKNQTTH